MATEMSAMKASNGNYVVVNGMPPRSRQTFEFSYKGAGSESPVNPDVCGPVSRSDARRSNVEMMMKTAQSTFLELCGIIEDAQDKSQAEEAEEAQRVRLVVMQQIQQLQQIQQIQQDEAKIKAKVGEIMEQIKLALKEHVKNAAEGPGFGRSNISHLMALSRL